MKIIVLLVIGVILYFISRSYKTEKFENIKLNIKERFNGDLMNHEAGLLVALMAKVAKADGQVCELEAELMKNTFNDISRHFENSEEIKEKLKDIYKKEKESFDNTIVICEKLYKITKNQYQKRLGIIEYLLNLAFIDKDFSKTEYMITEDISKALKIRIEDFENLVRKFESFYASQKASQALSLEKAYEVLNSSKDDDNSTLKKNYRKLVKEHHPDIVAGRGEGQDIIDQATKKLQEINEAYELIKKERNI